MIASIGWKTYLVFAIFNASFIPVIYFFYPETAGRSLEEIDVVFARAYVQGMSPVSVARSMPKLDVKEIEAAAAAVGIGAATTPAAEGHVGAGPDTSGTAAATATVAGTTGVMSPFDGDAEGGKVG